MEQETKSLPEESESTLVTDADGMVRPRHIVNSITTYYAYGGQTRLREMKRAESSRAHLAS